MYSGEVQVEKENLDEFMRACKKLELLGLSGETIAPSSDEKEVGEDDLASSEIIKDESDSNEVKPTLSESIHQSDTEEDTFEEIDSDVKIEVSMKEFKPNRVMKDGKSVFECGTCDYTSSGKHHLKYHIDSKHLNIRYPCGICDYSSQQPSDLKKHKKFKHDKIREFSCSACTYKAFDKCGLAKHASSKRCPIKEGGRIEKKLKSLDNEIN